MTETPPTGQPAPGTFEASAPGAPNAEDCPRCMAPGAPALSYPFVCPGHDDAAPATTQPLADDPAPARGTGTAGPQGTAEGVEEFDDDELLAAYRYGGIRTVDTVPFRTGGLRGVAGLVGSWYRTELDNLRGEVARLEAEGVDRMAERFVEEARIRSLEIRNGSVNLDMEPARELVAAWVGAARTMLGDAPNYTETVVAIPTDDDPTVSMEVKLAGEFERYAFTLQRVGKLTPHQARMRAEVERMAERGRADKAVALVAEILDADWIGRPQFDDWRRRLVELRTAVEDDPSAVRELLGALVPQDQHDDQNDHGDDHEAASAGDQQMPRPESTHGGHRTGATQPDEEARP